MFSGSMESVVQVIAGLAATTSGLDAPWTNLETWHHISLLSNKYIATKASAKKFEKCFGPHIDELEAHRARLQRVLARVQMVVEYNERRMGRDPDAAEDAETARRIIESLSAAIDVCDAQITPLQEQKLECQQELENAILTLLQQLESMAHLDDAIEEQPEVRQTHFSKDMGVPEQLDEIEAQLDQFDALQASGALEADSVWTDPEIVARDQEELQIKLAFNDRKIRQEELKSRSRTDAEEEELVEVELQIQELGHQLALLGVPIKNGSIVRLHELYVLRPGSWGHISDATQDESQGMDWSRQAYIESEEAGTPQCGLFDGADIEKPGACMDGDEVPLTRIEIETLVAKTQARVEEWLDNIQDEDEDRVSRPAEPFLGEVEADLIEQLSPGNSITRIREPARLSTWEIAMLESRQCAWKVQLSRDRKETAFRIDIESPEIERPPGYEQWLE